MEDAWSGQVEVMFPVASRVAIHVVDLKACDVDSPSRVVDTDVDDGNLRTCDHDNPPSGVVVAAAGLKPHTQQVPHVFLLDDHTVLHVFHGVLCGEVKVEFAAGQITAVVDPLPHVVDLTPHILCPAAGLVPCFVVLLGCHSGHPVLFGGVVHIGCSVL